MARCRAPLALLVLATLVSACGGYGAPAPTRHTVGSTNSWTLQIKNDSSFGGFNSPFPIVATIATNCFSVASPYSVTIQDGRSYTWTIGTINSGSCFFESSAGSITITVPANQPQTLNDTLNFYYVSEALSGSGEDHINVNCGLYGASPYVEVDFSYVYDFGAIAPSFGNGVCAWR